MAATNYIIQEIERQIAAGTGIDQLHCNVGSVKKAFIHLHHEHVEVLRWLVAHGADINLLDGHEWTALMYTALYPEEHYESLRFLLESGANVNIPHNKKTPSLKRTVLDFALRFDCPPFNSIRASLQYGAKLNIDGDNPYIIATMYYIEQHYMIYGRLALIAMATPRCLPRSGDVPLRLLPTDLLRKLKTYLLVVEV